MGSSVIFGMCRGRGS